MPFAGTPADPRDIRTAPPLLLMNPAYHSHILTKKTTKQKRNLCYSGTVSQADEAKIKNLLVK